MSDDNGREKQERTRPNANYKLSAEDRAGRDEDGELIFHYNRERRLERAPQAVRDLYAEKKPARFSLLKPLITGKPRAMLFFTIVALCLIILALSFFGYFDASHVLEGNKIAVKGTIFEDTVIIIVKKTTGKKKSAYTGAVEIAVSPAVKNEGDDYQVFYHKIFFSDENEETYRFAVPFDSQELIIVMQTEKSSLNFTMKPE